MNNFKKIKFSQLLASVKEDLHKYADEGLIDPSRLIKVVHRCNDVLGVNLYDRKQCVAEVEGGQADLPLDFYKMEMVLGVGEITFNSGLINPHTKKEFVVHSPACICDSGDTICVYPVDQPDVVIKQKTLTPLSIVGDTRYFLPNTPMVNWKGKYTVDVQEDTINLGFDKGTIFLSYLADLIDPDTGELLVPFHTRLLDYYEYSIKTKILEDLLMNSEADVAQMLQYVKRERNLACNDAVDFLMTKSYREAKAYKEKVNREFYNKYFSLFY